MKKQVKVLTTIIMVITIIATLGSTVLAAGTTLNSFDVSKSTADTSKIQEAGQTIVNILQVVGVVAAIAILTVIGIKYMMGSAEEKAEYKKVMIPYVLGAVLIFAATSIVKVVYSVANGGAN